MELFLQATRLVTLGILVYLAITLLPKVTISPRNKIIISIAVVVSYAFLDVIGAALRKVKVFLCGCEPEKEPEIII